MKKINVIKSFNTKKFKYGGYATLMTVVVLAVLIAFNLVVDQVPLRFDLTENRKFTLSEQTYNIIDNLDQEVTIYGLYETGMEDPEISEILRRYTNRSRNISFVHVDPIQDPQFARKYVDQGSSVASRSLVVESGSKFRVISAYQLYNYRTQNDPNAPPMVESLGVEQRVTSAIAFVTSDNNPTIYNLKGHGEDALPFSLRQQIEFENFEMKDINLLTEEEMPEDADILLVVSPKRDITELEADKIKDYLRNGGRAVFLMDLFMNTDFTNLKGVLESYGVGMQEALIVEGDARQHAGVPIWLVPRIQTHDIVTPLRTGDMPVLITEAQGIAELDVKRHTVEIKPLLVTSNSAWAKLSMDTSPAEKHEGDLSGPFNVAVAVTEKNRDADETKIIVIGSASFLMDGLATQVPGNANLLLNSLNWLQDIQETISIRPKSLLTPRLRITGFQQLLFAGIVVILIPLIILSMGLVVWLRRRHL